MSSVDTEFLSRLFVLAGWPIPSSLGVTLRNASLTPARWMERIPERPGHYMVSRIGRSVVLGEDLSPVEDVPTQSEPAQ